MEKFAGSIHQKLVPDPFLILVNSPIKPIQAKKHIWKLNILKEDYQKTFQNLT